MDGYAIVVGASVATVALCYAVFKFSMRRYPAQDRQGIEEAASQIEELCGRTVPLRAFGMPAMYRDVAGALRSRSQSLLRMSEWLQSWVARASSLFVIAPTGLLIAARDETLAAAAACMDAADDGVPGLATSAASALSRLHRRIEAVAVAVDERAASSGEIRHKVSILRSTFMRDASLSFDADDEALERIGTRFELFGDIAAIDDFRSASIAYAEAHAACVRDRAASARSLWRRLDGRVNVTEEWREEFRSLLQNAQRDADDARSCAAHVPPLCQAACQSVQHAEASIATAERMLHFVAEMCVSPVATV